MDKTTKMIKQDGALTIYEKDGIRYMEYRSFNQWTYEPIVTTKIVGQSA